MPVKADISDIPFYLRAILNFYKLVNYHNWLNEEILEIEL